MTRGPRLVMVGADYRGAALPERERLAYAPAELRALLSRARGVAGIREAMVLSTCNRTEFYLVVSSEAAVDAWLSVALHGRPDPAEARALLTERRWDAAAAQHLMRVACGLDSLLLGDGHIAGQVRSAFALATGCRATGPRLQQLAQRVSAAARRARATTDINRGSPSLGTAVASAVLAQQRTSHTPGSVLIVGAGAMAREVSAALSKAGLGPLCWVNRSPDGAARLAAQFGGTSLPWAGLAGAVADAATVITAVSARNPVVSAGLTRDAFARGTLFVDLGVPRNVQAVDGLQVLTIDSLRQQQDRVLARRRAAVPAVEALIAEELSAWTQWVDARPMERLIRQLYLDEAEHRRGLVDALACEAGVDPARAERLVRTSVRRLLHRHVSALRHRAPARLTNPSGTLPDPDTETWV